MKMFPVVVIELETRDEVAVSNTSHYGDHRYLLAVGVNCEVVRYERIVLETNRKQSPAKTEVKCKGVAVVVLALERIGDVDMLQIEEPDEVVAASSHHEETRALLGLSPPLDLTLPFALLNW